MFMLSIGNGLRSSNLMNLTIYDFNSCFEDPDFVGANILQNKTYKTSVLYGKKFIVLEYDLFEMIKLYLELLRPLLINDDNEDDEKRYIFVSSRSPVNCKPMTQSNIAQGLSATFLRSNVISRERALNISNSLTRATEQQWSAMHSNAAW